MAAPFFLLLLDNMYGRPILRFRVALPWRKTAKVERSPNIVSLPELVLQVPISPFSGNLKELR